MLLLLRRLFVHRYKLYPAVECTLESDFGFYANTKNDFRFLLYEGPYTPQLRCGSHLQTGSGRGSVSPFRELGYQTSDSRIVDSSAQTEWILVRRLVLSDLGIEAYRRGRARFHRQMRCS